VPDNPAGFVFIFLGAAIPVVIAISLSSKLPLALRPPVWWLAVSGGATAYLALLVERFTLPLVGQPFTASGAALIAFGLVAPIEETAKYALIQQQIAKRMASPRSLAIVGIAVGSGFAAVENAVYLFNSSNGWSEILVARLLSATPFHLANGAIAGLLAFRASRTGRPISIVAALLTIVALHGAYDAPLFAGGGMSAKYAFVLGLTIAVAVGSYQRTVASEDEER